MHSLHRKAGAVVAAAVAATALAAGPAMAQDQALDVSVKAPKALGHKQLGKGFKVTVTCSAACAGSVTLTSKNGIITQTSFSLGAAGSKPVKLAVAGLYLDPLKKGDVLRATAGARPAGADPQAGQKSAQAKIRVAG